MNRITSASALSAYACRAACAAACGFACGSIANANDCSPWDATIGQPGMNGAVWSLAALPNGDLIAGGSFTMAGAVEANRIARWDGSNWHALGDGVNGGVLALAVLPDGDVIAAGSFTMAGDVPANRIARWDGANWHALGDGLNGFVWDVAVMPDGDVIAGGAFTMAGGASASRIARWDGKAWHALGSGMDATVRAVEVLDAGDGPIVYAAGSFITAGGVEVNHVAKWNGQSWSPLETGVNGVVEMMWANPGTGGDDPALYMAGLTVNAADYMPLANGIGSWNAAREEWSPHGFGLTGEVRAMAAFDDGTGEALFASVSNGSSNVLMRWDGHWWMPAAPPVDGAIYALAVVGEGKNAALYVGGAFTTAGEVSAGGVAKWQSCPGLPPVTRHVPGQFATIQDAINAAEDGDVILVAPGVYAEAIDYLGKTIVVESEQGAEVTIIDASGLNTRGVTVTSGSGIGTVLRGFTITGGSANAGGGIGVAEATLAIDSCIITGNSVEGAGGGLYVQIADVLVINSAFTENSAHLGGGALVIQNVQTRFYDCVFRHNAAGNGGAINVNNQGNVMLVRCTIEENTVEKWPMTSLAGGGVSILSSAAGAILDQCDILHNTSMSIGGGVYSGGNLIMRGCRIAGNHAYHGGGGARLNNGWVLDCTFEDNVSGTVGGGAHLSSNIMSHSAIVRNSTFARNESQAGGGIRSAFAFNLIENTHFCENQPEHIDGNYGDLGGNTFAESCEPILGDLNGDGVVDVSDLLILFAAWGACPLQGECQADLNGDGAVDVSDLLILLSNWG